MLMVQAARIAEEKETPANAVDRVPLRVLFEKHCDSVGRLIRSLGVREADVDDAVQEVFIVAARRIGEINPGAERSFLFGVAVNVAAHARRSFARRREASEEIEENPTSGSFSPEELTDRRRARELLDRVLDTMDTDLRTVFVLFEISELSAPEISELLKIPVGTVASRLRRAREDFEERVRRIEARERRTR